MKDAEQINEQTIYEGSARRCERRYLNDNDEKLLLLLLLDN